MTGKKGTPNQKALYARDGYAIEDLQDMLEIIPKNDIQTRLQVYDRMLGFSTEMTKIYATEIVAAKVTNQPLRFIEHKELDEHQKTE